MVQFYNAVERYGKMILLEMYLANVNCWLAGGALRDYFSGVNVATDFDMFFPNTDEFLKARLYFVENGGKIVWESDNGCKIKYKEKTYDLVKKFFATPQDTIDAFDFTVSMFAVDLKRVYHGNTSFIDLAKKQLMINKITYPASTLSRAFKYHKKGFSICLGETKKLFEAIQDSPKFIEVETQQEDSANISSFGGFFEGID